MSSVYSYGLLTQRRISFILVYRNILPVENLNLNKVLMSGVVALLLLICQHIFNYTPPPSHHISIGIIVVVNFVDDIVDIVEQ